MAAISWSSSTTSSRIGSGPSAGFGTLTTVAVPHRAHTPYLTGRRGGSTDRDDGSGVDRLVEERRRAEHAVRAERVVGDHAQRRPAERGVHALGRAAGLGV